jgi:hypothetical protein
MVARHQQLLQGRRAWRLAGLVLHEGRVPNAVTSHY